VGDIIFTSFKVSVVSIHVPTIELEVALLFCASDWSEQKTKAVKMNLVVFMSSSFSN
jgi:hypothetical protein